MDARGPGLTVLFIVMMPASDLVIKSTVLCCVKPDTVWASVFSGMFKRILLS